MCSFCELHACVCVLSFLSSILMLSTIVPAYQTARTFPRFHSGNPSRVRAKAGHTGAAGGVETREGVCARANLCLCEHENMKGRRGEGWQTSVSAESMRETKNPEATMPRWRERRETKERGGIQSDKAPKQTHNDKERARSWTDCNRT